MLVLVIVSTSSATSETSGNEVPSDSLLYISDIDTRWHLENSDEAHFALLETRMIGHFDDWRERYSEQVLGFGVRTDLIEMSHEDLEFLKKLLLDPGSYVPGMKLCAMAGDAVVYFRGPSGEVTVVFELWCGRVHAYNRTTLIRTWGNVDPIVVQLRNLARKYFSDDEYVQIRLAD
jgi:hypothetical protein